jgi:hypothetical protein
MNVYKSCYFFSSNDKLIIETKTRTIKKEKKELSYTTNSEGIKFIKDKKNYYYAANDCKKIQ